MFGMIGMLIAIVATMFHTDVNLADMQALQLVAAAVVSGALIGGLLASRVVMTGMPQLVAILHSFVGLSAVLVGLATYLAPHQGEPLAEMPLLVHHVEIWLGVAIGAITFTGSVVAWAKLRGTIGGKPLMLPARHVINAVMVVSIFAMMVPFMQAHGTSGITLLLAMTVVACFLGIHLVMAIGGADMPVVVSLLNSYSGWSAAAAGFMLENDLLIVVGALVGSSGAILSLIMCRAMNRSILSVIFGGFGSAPAKKSKSEGEAKGIDDVNTADAAEVGQMALDSKSVIIVPGYGMAVARAQHLVCEFVSVLREKGVEVRFAIHPVAGRLPGHMNVLLAEAGVPYDIVMEMDELNEDCPNTDLVLVIGANDIVNPGAETDASSPIYGMPVIQAWKARNVVVLKRSLGAGYAGVGNPLFFNENTQMLFGDAKVSVQAMLSEVS
jgi:NAD(P) transhydrogenase subunit beta